MLKVREIRGICADNFTTSSQVKTKQLSHVLGSWRAEQAWITQSAGVLMALLVLRQKINKLSLIFTCPISRRLSLIFFCKASQAGI